MASEPKAYPCRGSLSGPCLSTFKFRTSRGSHEKTCRHFRAWKAAQPRMTYCEGGRVECSRCHKTYSEKTAFSRHKKNCERFSARAGPAAPENLRCGSCRKVFTSAVKLKCHAFRAHGERKCGREELQCAGCGATYMRRNYFEKHLDTCTEYLRRGGAEQQSPPTNHSSSFLNSTNHGSSFLKSVNHKSPFLNSTTHNTPFLDCNPPPKMSDIIAGTVYQSGGNVSTHPPVRQPSNSPEHNNTVKQEPPTPADDSAVTVKQEPLSPLKLDNTVDNTSGHLVPQLVFPDQRSSKECELSQRGGPGTAGITGSTSSHASLISINNLITSSSNKVNLQTRSHLIQQHAKVGKLFLSHLKRIRHSESNVAAEKSGKFSPEFLSLLDTVSGPEIVQDPQLLEFILRETAAGDP